MRMFKVEKWDQKITEVDVVRQTDSSIWIIRNGKERRENKSTSYYNYFETFSEAKDHIVARELRKFEYAKDAVVKAEKEYEKAKLISW